MKRRRKRRKIKRKKIKTAWMAAACRRLVASCQRRCGMAELLQAANWWLGFLICSSDILRTGEGPRDFGGVDVSTLEEVRAVSCGLPGSDDVMGSWICEIYRGMIIRKEKSLEDRWGALVLWTEGSNQKKIEGESEDGKKKNEDGGSFPDGSSSATSLVHCGKLRKKMKIAWPVRYQGLKKKEEGRKK